VSLIFSLYLAHFPLFLFNSFSYPFLSIPSPILGPRVDLRSTSVRSDPVSVPPVRCQPRVAEAPRLGKLVSCGHLMNPAAPKSLTQAHSRDLAHHWSSCTHSSMLASSVISDSQGPKDIVLDGHKCIISCVQYSTMDSLMDGLLEHIPFTLYCPT
jgi:hypothetical protein